jgi:hypothetical protein
MSALTPQVADPFCSELSGGCRAPLSPEQVAEGANQVDTTQTEALNDAFSSALGEVSTSPAVQGATASWADDSKHS